MVGAVRAQAIGQRKALTPSAWAGAESRERGCLVDNDLGPCTPHGGRHGARVEQVNESGFDADGAQILHLLRRARRPDDIVPVPVVHEQMH